MKEKVARRVGDLIKADTTQVDEELEREKAKRQAEEALARYKEQIQQKTEATEKVEEEGLKPVKKTLGPAGDQKPPAD
jgi:hypothetical protein